jgi:hypothetical protein
MRNPLLRPAPTSDWCVDLATIGEVLAREITIAPVAGAHATALEVNWSRCVAATPGAGR